MPLGAPGHGSSPDSFPAVDVQVPRSSIEFPTIVYVLCARPRIYLDSYQPGISEFFLGQFERTALDRSGTRLFSRPFDEFNSSAGGIVATNAPELESNPAIFDVFF